MGLVSKEKIEEVLAATDIVDLIGSYIPLKRAGTGYKANCPFHNEKTPSFNVSPSRQFYHCFGCGASGDAINFVKEHEGLLFMDALKKLATRAGVVVEDVPDDPKARAARRLRGRMLDLHREAAGYFHEQLKRNEDAQHARDYLKGRGFGREMAEGWEIGWMPMAGEEFLAWARERKYTGNELVRAGLAGQKQEGRPEAGVYVRFRDRLMFPIRNEVGDVIAFSGRQLRHDPKTGKYVNSPETDIFKKANVLFGLDRSKKAILKCGTVLLCEGQIDVIACHEAGVGNAIAPLGTAFTEEHARILKRYAKTAVICFDADTAGVKATERAFRGLSPEGLAVRVVRLPEGGDPDGFIRERGVEEFSGMVEKAEDYFDFRIEMGRRAGRLETAEGRAELTRECVDLLACMGDHAARDQRINVVASMLGVTATTLREGIVKALRRNEFQRRKAGRREGEGGKGGGGERPRAMVLDRTVGFLCRLALSSGPAQHFLNEQFETLHEAKAWVEGVPLLEKVLAGSPDTGSNAAVNAFLGTLREDERMALNREMGEADGVVDDGLQAAEAALGMLSSVVLQKRDAAVKAALKEPGISAERMVALLEQSKEIAGLLRWTGRSLYDDELPQETIRRLRKPWEKKREW